MPDNLSPPSNNPFDQIAGNTTPLTMPAPAAAPNPFDEISAGTQEQQPQSSGFGAFIRNAAGSVLPAVGGLAAAGAGAETGAEIGAGVGALFGGAGAAPGAAIGGLIGGAGGFIGGSYATGAAQDMALSKAPDTWKDALGQSDDQRKLDQEQHPYLSFLGGLAPYALTMNPFGEAPDASASALERVLKNPTTARVFGGAAMGGMELGQEKVEGEPTDWAKVAIATGFGIIFNRPNSIGESITGFAGHATTTAMNALGIAGPGIDAAVGDGTRVRQPEVEAAAQEAARQEDLTTKPQSPPDVEGTAEAQQPDIFQQYDALQQRVQTFRDQINDLSTPSDEAVNAAAAQRDALQTQLDAHIESQHGNTSGREARRLRAQLRDAQNQVDLLDQQRVKALSENPDIVTARQNLQATDYEWRDVGRQVAAARLSAMDQLGVKPIELEEPEEASAPEPSAPEPQNVIPIAPPAQPIEVQRQFIHDDVYQHLVAAGQPTDVADLSAQLTSALYETHAARTGQQPQALYEKEAPAVRGVETIPGPKGKEALGAHDIINGENIISLAGRANASTYIHELGHDWLNRILKDGDAPEAADSLKGDAAAIRQHIGAEEGKPVTAGQHEKFARAFERYLREGAAPSRPLIPVFDQFKTWLETVYKTLKNWGRWPINENIRNVFDRMLSEEPQRAYLMQERARQPTLAETHKAEAATVDPSQWEPLARRTDAERAPAVPIPKEIANEIVPALTEIESERAGAGGAEPAGQSAAGEPGRGEVDAGSGEAGAVAPGGGVGETAGGERAGVNAPVAEGAEVSGRQRGRGGRAGPGSGNPLESQPAPTLGQPDTLNLDPARNGIGPGLAGNIRIENLSDVPSTVAGIRDAVDSIDRPSMPLTDKERIGLAEDMGVRIGELDFDKIQNLFGGVKGLSIKATMFRMKVREQAEKVFQAGVEVAKAPDRRTQLDAIAVYTNELAQRNMMVSELSGVTTELGRAQRAFRKLQTGLSEKEMNAKAKENGMTLYQLEIMAKLSSGYKSPAQLNRFLNNFQKRTVGRAIMEYWINGLISGFATHSTYGLGNALLSSLRAGPETLAAGIIGDAKARFGVGARDTRVYKGEAVYGLVAGWKGLAKAVQAGIQGLRTGETTLLYGEETRPGAPFTGDTIPQVKDAYGDRWLALDKDRRAAQDAVHKADTPDNRAQLTAAEKAMEDMHLEMVHDNIHVAKTITTAPVSWREVVGDAVSGLDALKQSIITNATLVTTGKGGFGIRHSPTGQIGDLTLNGGVYFPAGTIARLPSRMVAAIHSFFRQSTYEMKIAALAYREAVVRGGDEMQQAATITDLKADPTEAMQKEAIDTATNTTMMGAGGEFIKQLSKLTNWSPNLPLLGETPILKFVDPFIHIAANVMDQSIVQRTPVGLLSPEIRAAVSGQRGGAAQDMAIGRMLVGTSLALTFGSLAARGLISGSGPSDRTKAAVWRMAGNQAHSIRIGDTWYDVHRLGSLGMLLGVSADMYDTVHLLSQGELLTAGSSLIHGLAQNMLDESFMRGPADLIQAIEDPDRFGNRYIQNFMSSFVPFSVGMQQMDRASDPYSRETRTVMDAIKQHIPPGAPLLSELLGQSTDLYPRRDIWGQPVPNSDALIAKGLTAIYQTQISRDPVNIALANLGMGIAPVERTISNVKLTDQQYDDYARIAGGLAKTRLDTIVRSAYWRSWAPEAQQSTVRATVAAARETARGMMKMKNPSIPAQATALRQARAR